MACRQASLGLGGRRVATHPHFRRRDGAQRRRQRRHSLRLRGARRVSRSRRQQSRPCTAKRTRRPSVHPSVRDESDALPRLNPPSAAASAMVNGTEPFVRPAPPAGHVTRHPERSLPMAASWTRGAARALRAIASRPSLPQPAAAMRAVAAASARAESATAHRALPGGAGGRTTGGAGSSRTGCVGSTRLRRARALARCERR